MSATPQNATTKPKLQPKSKEPKEAKEPKQRVRQSKNWSNTDKITVLSEENPKRKGSKAHDRFALYKTGMTVAEFIAAGGTYADLAWDSDASRKGGPFIAVA